MLITDRAGIKLGNLIPKVMLSNTAVSSKQHAKCFKGNMNSHHSHQNCISQIRQLSFREVNLFIVTHFESKKIYIPTKSYVLLLLLAIKRLMFIPIIVNGIFEYLYATCSNLRG